LHRNSRNALLNAPDLLTRFAASSILFAVQPPQGGLSFACQQSDEAPHYLIRDRDGCYGEDVRRTVDNLGIEEVLIAPHSPWQNPYCERLIGSIRRDCLNHVIVREERHLRRILKLYFDYYLNSRTHLALGRNAPNPREVEPPHRGSKILALPQVGGLHHRYARCA
jgi:hypothetical protein